MSEIIEKARACYLECEQMDSDGIVGTIAKYIEAENRERSEYLVGVIEERERLRRALEFYAKQNSWRTSTVYMCGHSGPSSAEIDRGGKARAALTNP